MPISIALRIQEECMLSIEQKSLPSESAIYAPKFLNHKLEQYTNNLMECLQKEGKSVDDQWIVFDLEGKILATGATPSRDEKSQYLF